MTYPIRVGLIVPSDVTVDYDAGAAVVETVEEMRAWLREKAGCTFDYSFAVHRTPLTKTELGTPPVGDPSPSQLDQCGQGLHETTLIERVVMGEMGWTTEEAGKQTWRWWLFVVNGGGWAGGRNTHYLQYPQHPTENRGHAIIGDWQLRFRATGQPDPCCVAIHGQNSGPCVAKAAAPHELLHCLNVLCHSGDVLENGEVVEDPHNVWPTDEGSYLKQGQIDALRKYNAEWLYDVAAPAPSPEPTPLPGKRKGWGKR